MPTKSLFTILLLQERNRMSYLNYLYACEEGTHSTDYKFETSLI